MRQDSALQPHPHIGILLMLGGMLMFSANDVLGKQMMSSFSAGQVMLMRSLSALLVLAPFLLRGGVRRIVQVQHRRLLAVRAALMAFEGISFYFAVGFLPLADVVTFWLAAPIYVAAMASLFLGEKVGLASWAAIVVGFAGVVVALNPSAQSLTPAALLALAGSSCFSVSMVLSRKLRGTPDTVMIFWQLVGAVVGSVLWIGLVPGSWHPMDAAALAALCLLGVVAMAANIMVNRAFKHAEASVVMPFQYSLLIWAILFGMIFFADMPRAAMLAGAALIIAAGLFIATRRPAR